MVVSKDLCFGAPRLVRIDEHHNLEVQSWDCRRPWIALRSRLPQRDFNTFGVRAVLTLFFLVTCVRSRVLLQSFLMILGPGGFPHERIAMKEQSRSLAERS